MLTPEHQVRVRVFMGRQAIVSNTEKNTESIAKQVLILFTEKEVVGENGDNLPMPSDYISSRRRQVGDELFSPFLRSTHTYM